MSTPAWQAKWIWIEGESRESFHVASFRHRFEAPAGRGKVLIAADSKYRLWVNGEYVGFGPARGHGDRPYYDTREVRLRKGANTVAVLVQHYTGKTAIFARRHGGLICEIRAGGRVVAASNRGWRAFDQLAYSGLAGMLMPERFDANLEQPGWMESTFDDRDWPAATELADGLLAPASAMLPRPIPLLRDVRREPVKVLAMGRCTDPAETVPGSREDIASSLWESKQEAPGEGMPDLAHAPWPGKPLRFRIEAGQAAFVSVDFGLETLAAPEVAIEGPAGIVADLGYSECLRANRVATRFQSLRQSERVVLREGLTRHRLLQPRGFRYLMLRLANPTRQAATVVLQELTAWEAIYPTRARGAFRCSDELLDEIYRLSARTVNLCMEDGYTDCPWRERAQWVGDAQPETLFSYFCFGEYALARKAVLEFTTGNTAEGWIPGVFPTSNPMNLPTWGMRVPVIAWEYVLYSGDMSVIGPAYEGVRKQMAWLGRYEGKDGLLHDLPGWCFVDWTATDDRHADGAVQGWYLEALEYAGALAAEAGFAGEAADCRRRAKRLRKTLATAYWSAEQRGFLKYRHQSPQRPRWAPPELLGQQEAFLFSLLGVGTAGQRRQALAAVAGRTGRYLPNLGTYQSAFTPPEILSNATGESVMKIGSPFLSYYALLALMEAGEIEAAVEYMRLGWGLMLEHGATSCWEMWDRHTSLCHGWSAAPAMILPAYLLGVRPTAPGFRRFTVAPRFGDLTWARGKVPTPHGPVSVSWRREGDSATLEVTVPEQTRATISAAVAGQRGWQIVREDGTRRRSVQAGPGRHRFDLRSGC